MNLHPRGSIQPFRSGHDYVIEVDGCWTWMHKRDAQGYGHLTGSPVAGERRAHRAAYAAANGPIPRGDHIHHRCENKACINPAHLEHHTHSRHLQIHRIAESPLTWDDVREIRRTHSEGGTSIDALGERYGLKKSAIHRLIKNETWHDPNYTPGRMAVCPLLECGETFIATRHHQRFCCGEHRNLHNNRVPGGYVERRLRRAA